MHEAGLRVLVLVGALALSLSCEPVEPPPPSGPYVLVLGTAQDAGFPQIGSDHPRAREAWEKPELRRRAASLLVVDPRSGKRWLIDATPDLREQLRSAHGEPASRSVEGPRPPLFDGIFLTHAHMGHYTGLVHLGREAYGARGQPVHGSERMCAFLERNAPWNLLIEAGHIRLEILVPDRAVRLADDLTLTPIPVPHRDEFTDTFGFVVRGPSRALLYLPDIDKWDRWDRKIEDEIRAVDFALLDGTFFEDGEIPGRDMAEIPHPFIEESISRFASLPEPERAKVHFTHLNHTNAAVDSGGEAQRRIGAAGHSVAAEGQRFPL